MSDDNDFVLTVFVRTNFDSMNEGKGQAHSGHAANAFVFEQYINSEGQAYAGHGKYVGMWMDSTKQGFGTQNNKKVENWNDLEAVYQFAKKNGYAANFVLDPSYPFEVSHEVFELLDPKFKVDAVHRKDSVICHRPEITGFYIFGRSSDKALQDVLRKFPRHP
jgi:hypothetical protein